MQSHAKKCLSVPNPINKFQANENFGLTLNAKVCENSCKRHCLSIAKLNESTSKWSKETCIYLEYFWNNVERHSLDTRTPTPTSISATSSRRRNKPSHKLNEYNTNMPLIVAFHGCECWMGHAERNHHSVGSFSHTWMGMQDSGWCKKIDSIW